MMCLLQYVQMSALCVTVMGTFELYIRKKGRIVKLLWERHTIYVSLAIQWFAKALK